MNIAFTPLSTSYFPLLLKWLETPHVKAWWDQNTHWTKELIEQKYENYVHGFKRLTLEDNTISRN
jgi:aminoglycoside 6'-N-acetyltransferase